MKETRCHANGWALVPLLVFAVFSVGLSLCAERCGLVLPWLGVPIAFLMGLAVSIALLRRSSPEVLPAGSGAGGGRRNRFNITKGNQQ